MSSQVLEVNLKSLFIKMNNKGQVLVIFVVILPILLMILGLIVDLGLFALEKRKIDNNVYDAVDYYLDNIDNENVKINTAKLLESNLDDIKIDIIDENDYIEIIATKDYKSIYTIISNNQNISIKYRGIKEAKEIIKG